MLMKIRDQKGFTLIELLIVVIILGILAVVAIPRFTFSRQQAELNACKTNQRMLNDAVSRYNFENTTPLADSDETALKTALQPYIRIFPKCPAGGSYSYKADEGAVTCSKAEHK